MPTSRVLNICELPHTDQRYSVGFPIHRELPLERALYWPNIPSKGRSPGSPDHRFSCNLYLFAWCLRFDIEAQDVPIITIGSFPHPPHHC
jgi:hypothetical protein